MQVKPTLSDINSLKGWTKLVFSTYRPRIAYTIGCTTSLIVMMSTNCAVFAQLGGISSTPEICDVDLTLLKPTEIGSDPNIITADTVSPKGTTIPSLWWTNEQIPSKLLVNNWIANRRQHQIYLLVNTQYWNILDYVDRYRTIDRFGRVAQSYGYNLKLCNTQKVAIARYTCDVLSDSITQKSSTAKPPQTCQIWLNGTDQNGMGVKSK